MDIFTGLGLFGIIGLVLGIWAIINIVQSDSGALGKAIWIVLVLVLPVLGWLIWFFFGPRTGKDTRRGAPGA